MNIHKYTDSLSELFGYLLGLIILSGLAFSFIEGETVFRSLYWATITTTTVGYGDISPKTTAGMALAMFTAISGIVLMALFTAKVYQVLIKDENQFTHDEQERIINLLEKMEKKLP